MKVLGFCSSMAGTFCGTKVFRTLKEHSFIRTLFHLALMSALVSILISSGEYSRIKNYIQTIKIGYSQTFGEKILISREAIIPELNPERSRTFALGNSGLLGYVGINDNQLPFTERDWDMAKILILWNSQGFWVAVNTGENQWSLMWQRPNGMPAWETNPMGLSEIKARFSAIAAETPKMVIKSRISGRHTEKWFDQILSVLTGLIVVCNWVMVFFTTLLHTGLFVTFFAISGLKKMRAFNWRSLWKTGIYASFPVSLVAGFFPAFELPGPGYSTIFTAGLIIYYLVIIATIEREVVTISPPEGD